MRIAFVLTFMLALWSPQIVRASVEECHVTVLHTCATDGACLDQEIALCEPDTHVVVETLDPPPFVGFLFRRGIPAPSRKDANGGVHFELRNLEGTREVCSLPTHGQNAVFRPLLPLGTQAHERTGRIVTVNYADLVLDLPAGSSVMTRARVAITALNDDLARQHIALRFREAESNTLRPIAQIMARNLPAALNGVTKFNGPILERFGASGPTAYIFIDPSRGGFSAVIHEVLHAVGLGHNLWPIEDSVAGAMPMAEAVSRLSQCEAALLRTLYGHDGSGVILSP